MRDDLLPHVFAVAPIANETRGSEYFVVAGSAVVLLDVHFRAGVRGATFELPHVCLGAAAVGIGITPIDLANVVAAVGAGCAVKYPAAFTPVVDVCPPLAVLLDDAVKAACFGAGQ